MFRRLFRGGALQRRAAHLHQDLVRWSRQPALFLELGIPDTVEGRFEAVTLHAALLLRRLYGVDDRLARAVFDRMWDEMDLAIRELGVGDMSVGKKMKLLGASFYGRGMAYDAALRQDGQAGLEAALLRNLYDGADIPAEQLQAMGLYVREAAGHLDQLPDETLLRGELPLPAGARQVAA